MGNDDILNKKIQPKARKAAAHHSSASEHFRGSFPLFVNRFQEGFELRQHDHDFVELVYVMSGEGYHYVGDSMERTFKGCLYVLPVGTSHIFRPSGASGKTKLVVYNLCIRPAFIGELRSWLGDYGAGGKLWSVFEGAPGSHIRLVDHSMRLGRVFEQLHQEFEERKPGYEASMLSVLLQLTVQIARQLETERKAEGGSGAGPGAGRRRSEMSAILGHIDEHLTEPLTLERLAEKAGMSLRHFIRKFRQWTGMGFSDYLQRKRIDLACRLLLETDDKIDHIAKSTGYRDLAHFRQVFRKWMGVSPSQYRRGGELPK
ncbi:AraC family transcriptional regulator [Paenibacillus soyae]|uniref:AraC family transcriptional regulator n=1 Tax=Paenibacillus soyae TaxID=2969249 RepID=A0A9X2MV07_9BACL|nr:AraC family transcriptional regulator [Paenibacillus soyae]MCR2807536.1 AraC family transcriptional regulator [Paenibacillus soyae]